MPLDLATGPAALSDPAMLHGVARTDLVRHALAGIPAALRGAVAEIELAEAGQFLHMGLPVEQVAWRTVWRRPGLPVMTGTIAIWNGTIV